MDQRNGELAGTDTVQRVHANILTEEMVVSTLFCDAEHASIQPYGLYI